MVPEHFYIIKMQSTEGVTSLFFWCACAVASGTHHTHKQSGKSAKNKQQGVSLLIILNYLE